LIPESLDKFLSGHFNHFFYNKTHFISCLKHCHTVMITFVYQIEDLSTYLLHNCVTALHSSLCDNAIACNLGKYETTIVHIGVFVLYHHCCQST
jgi:hypothetical protein